MRTITSNTRRSNTYGDTSYFADFTVEDETGVIYSTTLSAQNAKDITTLVQAEIKRHWRRGDKVMVNGKQQIQQAYPFFGGRNIPM